MSSRGRMRADWLFFRRCGSEITDWTSFRCCRRTRSARLPQVWVISSRSSRSRVLLAPRRAHRHRRTRAAARRQDGTQWDRVFQTGRPLFGPTLHVTKVKESHLTEMSGSSESLEFIGRGRSPQRGKEASFYDAKRVERCFFSRRGGHRPEEQWAFYWQKKPPFSGPRWGPRKGDAKKPATANAVSIKRDAGRLPLRANPIQEQISAVRRTTNSGRVPGSEAA